MQTFLPYADYSDSARVLDYRRLGKQRLEAKQILDILLNGMASKWYPWRNHPVVKMWKGYEHRLNLYGRFICLEWRKRGYVDNQYKWFIDQYAFHHINCKVPKTNFTEALHTSHRAALLYKNPEWYSQFGWKEKPEIKYVWL